jgi:hypothetical protein
MANAIRSIACAVACAGSIMGAGLGAAAGDGGYFVVVLGFLGFLIFGLFTIRTVSGTVKFAGILEYLFSADAAEDEVSKLD